ncbi:MAG: TAT-variant-translocated molybdopterin oxidoreductase [Verrucomicrobiales bacterium]|nr:TAT-variant-translocated molybdopterin oxidoreductase [Verrucomicrobiales bacterium]MCP5525577.1 TAT-variant-translocated molybdopterin oxidoreductase [Verrucomicrobiales bacterium]
MKPVPSSNGGPVEGPVYWRSPEQLADSPAFREWAEREFPPAASEFFDPVSRRNFVKLMSASLALAGVGLTGCRRPEENILPFTKVPEGYVHGVPQHYATAMPVRGSAVPLVVKAHEGRPVKVEGNAEHPLNRRLSGEHGPAHGGTDLRTQASLLDLYDPDRARRCTFKGETVSAERALDAIAREGKVRLASGGSGLAILTGDSSSPTRARLQRQLAERLPQARWFVDEPVGDVAAQAAIQRAFGQALRPLHHFDRAKRVVSLDCDFVALEDESWRHIRGFAKARRVQSPADEPARLYAVESLMTSTGACADHRLRLSPSRIFPLACWLAAEVLETGGDSAGAVALRPRGEGLGEEARQWAAACAKDLVAHQGEVLVVAGSGQPEAVHFLAILLNAALGGIGKVVDYLPDDRPSAGTIEELAQALNRGEVQTLVILGANPVYTAPADLDWAATQRKAGAVIRLGYQEDETAADCDWHLPAAHYLESWGDARTADGTVVPVQPLIEPLFGGVTEIEVLARLLGLETVRPYDLVRETFREMRPDGHFENAWGQFLHDGFLADSALVPVEVNADGLVAKLPDGPRAVESTPQSLELVFFRDPKLDDGRHANNGWLQELPDPMSKITWDNVVLLSKRTAAALGVRVVDDNKNNLRAPVVRIELDGRSVEGPAWIQPGLADNTVALALGYGRPKGGRIARGAGFNVYPLRTSRARHQGTGAKLTLLGRSHPLSCTQNHWHMMGRPVVREGNLEEYRQDPHFARAMDLPAAPDMKPIYPNPLDELGKKAHHQWGLSVDLSRCVGCNACVIACQSENNIPIVGKDQVRRHREMHWIRVDRYFTGPVEDPQVINQPMMCQHCEAAPCESVCPVNATVHDAEGLNLMVYNRCVGTRYCSNNCPYKVRRFNFFDYNRRPLNALYKSPLVSSTDGQWEMKRWFKNPDRGSKPQDEWDLLKLARNPDVTVRMRGVMEKCTFCLQRIEQAKIARKVQARDSGDVVVADGGVKTACQQACPAEAIVFGNLKDPHSHISAARNHERTYEVLDYLAVKPRVTYQARVRNPNSGMPDHHATPFSTREFIDGGGALHGAGGHDGATGGAGEAAHGGKGSH